MWSLNCRATSKGPEIPETFQGFLKPNYFQNSTWACFFYCTNIHTDRETKPKPTTYWWPGPLGPPGTLFMEDNLPTDQNGAGLGVIRSCCIYCALYFYCHCISSTSDHQVSDLRGWGPLLWGTLHSRQTPEFYQRSCADNWVVGSAGLRGGRSLRSWSLAPRPGRLQTPPHSTLRAGLWRQLSQRKGSSHPWPQEIRQSWGCRDAALGISKVSSYLQIESKKE